METTTESRAVLERMMEIVRFRDYDAPEWRSQWVDVGSAS